ncbi:MAG: CNNM domain-containing protein [Candidatus Saccharibacteria bacterium]|nr:CNNM domain-containing protein [Candidatus Saccharibacteria bacterium]
MDNIKLAVQAVVLVGMSAVCSGLNLSLMSLDLADLKRKAKLGDKRAKAVLPLRKNGHLSLVSILFTNVAVISTTSLTLEHRFSGLVAGIASTLLIVVFGEIFPQAIFVRRPLDFTAKLAPILKVMIFITYPLSKPLQLLLDKLFKHQPGSLHSRQELGLLIAEHVKHTDSELDDSEVEIIRGALSLSEKHVRNVMTPIRRTYYLFIDDIIDGDKIDEIKRKMYSRIPVFNPSMTECYGLVLMKDLVDMDFDETAIAVRELNLHPTRPIGRMTALDTIFRRFIAARTHLMPVTHGDKFCGIVTIEDVVEEIIGQEIEDEHQIAHVL